MKAALQNKRSRLFASQLPHIVCALLVVVPVIYPLPLRAQAGSGAAIALPSRSDASEESLELAGIKDLVRRGNYEAAARSLHAFLADYPQSPDGHFLLGYVLYRQNKPTDSLAEYTKGASYRTPDADDLSAVAMDYILLRDYIDADTWLTKATAWDPSNALDWYYLGRTRYTENRFQEAIDAFQRCLALHPKDVRAEYNIGLSYAGLGKREAAADAYKTAVEWQRGEEHPDPQPYLDLGILLLDENHAAEALPDLETAAELDSSNPKAHEELGRAYEKLDNLPKAQLELERALALAGSIPALHFELGRIYQKEGLDAKAREQFAQCAALDATHSSDAVETPNSPPHP